MGETGLLFVGAVLFINGLSLLGWVNRGRLRYSGDYHGVRSGYPSDRPALVVHY